MNAYKNANANSLFEKKYAYIKAKTPIIIPE